VGLTPVNPCNFYFTFIFTSVNSVFIKSRGVPPVLPEIRFRELAKIITNFIKSVLFAKIEIIGYNRKNSKMFGFLVLIALKKWIMHNTD